MDPYGTNLDPAIADGLSQAIKDGDQIVQSSWKNLKGFYINGWTYNTKIGTYGYIICYVQPLLKADLELMPLKKRSTQRHKRAQTDSHLVVPTIT